MGAQRAGLRRGCAAAGRGGGRRLRERERASPDGGDAVSPRRKPAIPSLQPVGGRKLREAMPDRSRPERAAVQGAQPGSVSSRRRTRRHVHEATPLWGESDEPTVACGSSVEPWHSSRVVAPPWGVRRSHDSAPPVHSTGSGERHDGAPPARRTSSGGEHDGAPPVRSEHDGGTARAQREQWRRAQPRGAACAPHEQWRGARQRAARAPHEQQREAQQRTARAQHEQRQGDATR